VSGVYHQSSVDFRCYLELARFEPRPLDVYIWLAYRLHALKRDTEVSWAALYGQFGAGFKRLRAFRSQFFESLQLALAAYPEAQVSFGEAGITLHPSRPAIAKL